MMPHQYPKPLVSCPDKCSSAARLKELTVFHDDDDGDDDGDADAEAHARQTSNACANVIRNNRSHHLSRTNSCP